MQQENNTSFETASSDDTFNPLNISMASSTYEVELLMDADMMLQDHNDDDLSFGDDPLDPNQR